MERVDLRNIVEALPETVRLPVLNNTGAIQLTEGCSGACGRVDFCGFRAVKGIGRQMEADSVTSVIRTYGSQMPKLGILYFASDTGDYYDYPGLLDEVSQSIPNPRRIFTSTAVPIGREAVVAETIEVAGKYRQKVRLSIRPRTAERIHRFLKEYYGPEAYVPANVKLDGIDGSVETWSGYAKKKPLLGYEQINAFMVQQYLRGIDCFDGVLFTPDGAYGVITTASTMTHPDGYIKWPIKTEEDIIPQYVSLDHGTSEFAGFLKPLKAAKINGFAPDEARFPLEVRGLRALLDISGFLYQLADYNSISVLGILGVSEQELLDRFNERLEVVQEYAQVSADQEVVDLARFINEAVTDLSFQRSYGRKSREVQWLQHRIVRQGTYGLIYDYPELTSTDLTPYK